MPLEMPHAVGYLPFLYDTEDIPEEERKVYFVYFTPESNWAWIPVEYSPEKDIFFGYVIGHDEEWGYFSYEEINGVNTNVTPIDTLVFGKPKKFLEARDAIRYMMKEE